MTRINVVPPAELCDQHLLAEHRELTRVPSAVLRANGSVTLSPAGAAYCLGVGHVRFFYDKLGYLLERYSLLHAECVRRGFNVQLRWPAEARADTLGLHLFGYYVATPAALALNRERITARMPQRPRFTEYK
jgi:hypothetical protein